MELLKEFKSQITYFESQPQTISEHESRNVTGVFTPNNLNELQSFVQICQTNKINIHVYSSGKNWGQGSFLPVSDEPTMLIDLSQMNSIIDHDEDLRYIVIEPGVTQLDIAEYLSKNNSTLKSPVTGSSVLTTAVGNILDRGVVSFAHRNKNIIAMEVLLPNGELIKTGFWSQTDQNDEAFYYPDGVGPDIKGLFTQSNLGIVTKLALRLPRKLEGEILIIDFHENEFESVVNNLKELYETKILDEGILITNRNDPRTAIDSEFQYCGDWMVCASYSGPQELLELKQNLVKKSFNQFETTKLEFISTVQDKSQNHPYYEVLVKMYNGIPTNFALETMAGINNTLLENENIDENKNMLGFSVALPAVPFKAEKMLKVISIVNGVSEKIGVHPYHNFASVDELTFEGFYRIYFDRKNQNEIDKANKWNKTVHQELLVNGFQPYRINIDRMNDVIAKSPLQDFLSEVKKLTDKNQVLSAKRYILA